MFEFSVIVPTHDRPEQLGRCLQALSSLDHEHGRFEVIVVDDGSKRPPEAEIRRFETSLNLRLLEQERAGPAAARNRGAALAQGGFFAFTDDDCIPDTQWLHALSACFERNPNCLIGGCTLNALPDNPYSTASQMLIRYLYSYYNGNCGREMFFTSNNMALPAEAFRRLGGFDVAFPLAAGEDREFCGRWLDNDSLMIFVPEAIVYHAHPMNFLAFYRQHFNYGRGAFHYHCRRKLYGKERISLEPPAFYLNLLRYPFTSDAHRRAWLHSMLLAFSQVANASGFFWEMLGQIRR